MDTKSPKPRRYDQPSFSSTLLDAIYRSIDDSQPHPKHTSTSHLPNHSPAQRYYYNHSYHNTTASSVTHRSSSTARQRSAAWAQSTSSSSDCSSYGGFSSSEAESVRLKPIRTAHRPDPLQYHFPAHSQSPASNSTEMDKNKKKSTSIKSRIKEFRKTKQQLPASPGARLASLLNAIFPKKTSSTVAKPAGSAPEVGSTCSSASSYSRSCLSKTPSTVKRSVRFCPVNVVVGGEEEEAREGRREAEGKRRVAEILRGIEREEEEEEEEEEESSDSSSDLFELEDLSVTVGIVGSERRRLRDELPVYGTTSLGINSRGLGLGLAHGTTLL